MLPGLPWRHIRSHNTVIESGMLPRSARYRFTSFVFKGLLGCLTVGSLQMGGN